LYIPFDLKNQKYKQMKKVFFILAMMLSIFALHAQKDSTFYRHEVKISTSGEAILANIFWISDKSVLYANLTFSYFYRPLKWLWVGGNFVNYFGSRLEYKWKEYYPDGTVRSFSKSKIKYVAGIAPEIRFSYLNRRHIVLYSALSGGICFEDGYESRHDKYPEIHYFFQTTLFGISGSFGKNANIFLGGEFGLGYKGTFIFHGGYRF
jgi:hypothetical protein